MKYTKSEIESAYDDYITYKQLADESKERFEKMCQEYYDEGDIYMPSGRRIVQKSRTTQKVDTLMLSTLHSDVWDKIVDSGAVSVSPKALTDYGDDVKDCIETKTTTYFTLSN